MSVCHGLVRSAITLPWEYLSVCVCVCVHVCVCPVLQAGKVPVFIVPGSWRGHLVHLCLWEFPIRLSGTGIQHQFHHIFMSRVILLVYYFRNLNASQRLQHHIFLPLNFSLLKINLTLFSTLILIWFRNILLILYGRWCICFIVVGSNCAQGSLFRVLHYVFYFMIYLPFQNHLQRLQNRASPLY